MKAPSQPYIFRGRVLPDNLRESLDAYVESGRPTGGFLEACIGNNLNQACASADAASLDAIPAVVGYLYNECPSPCWGKSDSFEKWIQMKRDEREEAGRE